MGEGQQHGEPVQINGLFAKSCSQDAQVRQEQHEAVESGACIESSCTQSLPWSESWQNGHLAVNASTGC
jgi:hypothetical protein